jgi:non-specific serine/threonine protein kinase
MAAAIARVEGGLLILPDVAGYLSLEVGGQDWEHWLQRPETDAFRFEGGPGTFTARRETSRGREYWYAYRRAAGRLRKAYLGRSRDVDLTRLTKAARQLAATPETGSSVGAFNKSRVRSGDIGAEFSLPVETSSFVGRGTEIQAVRHALLDERLVTLTGTGGVGKTRLALQVASGEEADAVWVVELAQVTEPSLVPQAVALAIGTREQRGTPLPVTIARSMRIGAALLVLDNCEHVRQETGRLAELLLRTCPNLRILATSREPLGVQGEAILRVPSLALPTAGESQSLERISRVEAVRLFVARAQAMRPDFALSEQNAPVVLDICRRLDGIPLAIELAAVRMRALDPEDLAARLDEPMRLLTGGRATSRFQTLQAAIESSFDTLPPEERLLFEQLSVFAGSFGLSAAEAVCGGEGVETAVIADLVTMLVDRSLLTLEASSSGEGARYRLLEVLRAFGRYKLGQRGDLQRMYERHARWIVEQSRRAEEAFHGPEEAKWLKWAERYHAEINAALRWTIDHNHVDLALCLASGIAWPWMVQRRWSEGLQWSMRVLDLSKSVVSRERANVLVGATQFLLFRGHVTSNRPSGDFLAVRAWIKECWEIGRKLEDDWPVRAAHGLQGLLGEFGVEVNGMPAVTTEEIQEQTPRTSDPWGECRGLEEMSRRALEAGDVPGAIGYLREAENLALANGDAWSLAMALHQLGDVEFLGRAHRRALQLYDRSLTIFTELGLGAQPELVLKMGAATLECGDAQDAATHFRRAMTEFRRMGEGYGVVDCIYGLASVASVGGRAADAARLFGAGDAALRSLKFEPEPPGRPDFRRWRVLARGRRRSAVFDRAYAEGSALPMSRAVTLASELGTHGGALTSPRRTSFTEPTARELEVARLAAVGLTDRQIAGQLSISPRTVANHLQRVRDKLELESRTQLAAQALRLGLL